MLDHLRKPSVRHVGGRSGAKVAAGNASPSKNSKSFKSIRSIRSNRTGGRADDDELWEYSTAMPDLLNEPTNEQALAFAGASTVAQTNTGDANALESGAHEQHVVVVPPEIKRQPSRKKPLNLEDSPNNEQNNDINKRVRSQDLYGAYTTGDNREDDDFDGSDLENDEPEFDEALTAEAQDELAYFSQRIGHADFKLARRLVIHPHGRTRAFWDSVLMLLISCTYSDAMVGVLAALSLALLVHTLRHSR